MSHRLRWSFVVGWAGSIAIAACAAASGCFTAPPPAVSTPPLPRPTIIQQSVQPPLDQLLFDWPSDNTFLVPVQLGDPTESFVYDVFVDYAIASADNPNPLPNFGPVSYTPAGDDDGGVLVRFELSTPIPTTTCHTIQFLVVHGFATLEAGTPLDHVPDSVGGDSVTWFYTPGGSLDGCAVYDAGIYEDGATPSDGPSDAPDAEAPEADEP